MSNGKPAWKKYRENLGEQLTNLRGKKRKWWNIFAKSGKELAENLLAQKQETRYYKDMKEEKFKHFRTKQGIEIIEDSLEEGNINIDINHTDYGQKWILAINPKAGESFFMSHDKCRNNPNFKANHSDLLSQVKNDYFEEDLKDVFLVCLGGGRMEIDNKKNKVFLYSSSESYGSINEKLHPYLIKALEKEYPNYEVMFGLPYQD